MSEREKESFYKALETDAELKKEFIKQKNLWAVSTSLGMSKTSSSGDMDVFLYRLNSKKTEVKTSKRLKYQLSILKVAAVVMFALLVGSAAMILRQSKSIEKSEVFYTETYVPKGENSELTLPDGTHLFINADTRIKIPSDFSASNRRLKINGEAYFNVTHDSENPFVVITESINIEVLGTSFNLSCYKEEEFVTTSLDEGSIRFSGANNNKVNGIYLQPGKTAHYHKSSGLLKVHETNTTDGVSSWREGVLKFRDMPFYQLAKKIERLYDVEIVIDESLKFEKYTGEINEETVWAVMNNFAIATPFNVESSGRKITVMPKKNFK